MKPSQRSTLEDHGPDGRSPYLDNLKGIPYRDICGKCGARRIDNQIGLEPTPDAYVETMVGVFREVWRVLRDDGVCWVNLGDAYAHGIPGGGSPFDNGRTDGRKSYATDKARGREKVSTMAPGLKPKDLCGIPWRVAFALQADGWYLRSDIIWAKPNPMPESVTDRPTRSHEYIFLLSKSERYFYDADAIREEGAEPQRRRLDQIGGANGHLVRHSPGGMIGASATRNKRDVWTVNSEPTPEAHFATFPQKLIEPCILAGTSERGCCAECGAPRVRVTETENLKRTRKVGEGVDTDIGTRGRAGEIQSVTLGWQPSCSHDAPSVPCVVFDPFLGSGTVGKVCERLGRRWVGLELSESYIEIAQSRTAQMGLGL